jgi:HAD superfamily hydrolase (TIGR01509 family)
MKGTTDIRPVLRGLVVDLDGLLIDSETWSWQAHDIALARFGLAGFRIEEIRALVGLDADQEWDAVRSMRSVSVTRVAYFREHREAFIALRDRALAPLPGVRELLEVVDRRGWRLGLASNSALPSITAALVGLGIREHFGAVASADEVPHGKPDPSVYQLAMQRLDLLPEQAAALEDSPAGLQAAHAAGMFCIAVPSAITATLDFAAAHRRFVSRRDAADWLGGRDSASPL